MPFSGEKVSSNERVPELTAAYQLLSTENPRFFTSPIDLDRQLTQDEKLRYLKHVSLKVSLMREQLEYELQDSHSHSRAGTHQTWTWNAIVRERLAALQAIGFTPDDIPDMRKCADLIGIGQ